MMTGTFLDIYIAFFWMMSPILILMAVGFILGYKRPLKVEHTCHLPLEWYGTGKLRKQVEKLAKDKGQIKC